MKRELIILGNGFDLACKLKTNYIDFYEVHFTEDYVNEIKQFIDKKVDARQLNLWSFILYHFEKPELNEWFDVEATLDKNLRKMTEEQGDVWKYAQIIIREKHGKKGNFDDIKAFILLELNEFETKFEDYIDNELLGNVEQRLAYNKNAQQLIDKISGFEKKKSWEGYYTSEASKDALEEIGAKRMPNDSFFNPEAEVRPALDKHLSLLTFNYTVPDLISGNKNTGQLNLQTQNVHGRIRKGEIIFGIDGTDVDEQLRIFTKAYRRLDIPQEQFLIERYDIISFYGHSLGKSDYGYFQAIFDYIDLYNGKTQLQFFYSAYEDSEEKKEQQRQRYKLKINRLLTTYGNTLDNKDHGKNLLYKLGLEGRIVIKEIINH